MIYDNRRITSSACSISVGKFIEEHNNMEWLNEKHQHYALTLPLEYRAEMSTYGINGNVFNIFDVAERLRLLDYENCTYWYILHDADLYTEKDAPDPSQVGRLKNAHIHLVLDFHREVRASTCLKLICRLFGTNPKMDRLGKEWPDLPLFIEDDQKVIRLNPWLSIEAVNHLVKMLAYIVHETSEARKEGKHLYPHNRVMSNDKPTFECACELNSRGIEVITPTNLITLVRVCDYKTSKILLMLGIKDYLSLRTIIKDLQSERV